MAEFNFNFFAGDETPGESGITRDEIYQAAMTDEEIDLRKQQEIAAFRMLYDVRSMNQEQADTLQIAFERGDLPDYVQQQLLADVIDLEVEKGVAAMNEEPVTKESIAHPFLIDYIFRNPTNNGWMSRLATHLQNGGSLTKPQVDSAYKQMKFETTPDSDRAA